MNASFERLFAGLLQIKRIVYKALFGLERRTYFSISYHRQRIYVCHPFRDDPKNNAHKVSAICRAIVEEGHLPIAPHIYLPAFVDEETERDLAMALCLELVSLCDKLRVYGGVITEGMWDEIDHAEFLEIPVSLMVLTPEVWL